jgi:hypothetical protein
MRKTISRRLGAVVTACVIATTGVSVATAAPAMAACTGASVSGPGITVEGGSLRAFGYGQTSGCGYGPWSITLFRSRWFGWENMGAQGWQNDGSGRVTAVCAGTHDWWALMQKNGLNYISQYQTMNC